MKHLLDWAVAQGMGLVKRGEDISNNMFTKPGLLKCTKGSIITSLQLAKVEAELLRIENKGSSKTLPNQQTDVLQ